MTRPVPALSRPLVILWVGMVAAIVVFVALGSLRIGAGNWIGRRMPIREIWSRFIGYLADEGASAMIVLGVTLAAAITLIGAAYALWLAFALKDAPVASLPDDPAER